MLHFIGWILKLLKTVRLAGDVRAIESLLVFNAVGPTLVEAASVCRVEHVSQGWQMLQGYFQQIYTSGASAECSSSSYQVFLRLMNDYTYNRQNFFDKRTIRSNRQAEVRHAETLECPRQASFGQCTRINPNNPAITIRLCPLRSF